MICVQQDGASPIFCAVQEGHWDVVELLIDKDADVNTQVRSYLHAFPHLAVHTNYVSDFVQLNKGPTPLYIAAQEGYKSLVVKLIKHEANVNKRAHVRACDSVNMTIAPAKHFPSCQYFCLEVIINVHATSMHCAPFLQGITPLFIACQERHVGVTRALMNGKADPNRRNKV